MLISFTSGNIYVRHVHMTFRVTLALARLLIIFDTKGFSPSCWFVIGCRWRLLLECVSHHVWLRTWCDVNLHDYQPLEMPVLLSTHSHTHTHTHTQSALSFIMQIQLRSHRGDNRAYVTCSHYICSTYDTRCHHWHSDLDQGMTSFIRVLYILTCSHQDENRQWGRKIKHLVWFWRGMLAIKLSACVVL